MRLLKSVFVIAGMTVMAYGLAGTSVGAENGNLTPQDRNGDGPPEWVVEAWETGNPPVVPESGPPAWVVEAWSKGEAPQRPDGMPPWVARRHAMAKEMGLPGPPDEVLEAWENGDGESLPGPPDFVRELFGF